jgi:hypothetical protein
LPQFIDLSSVGLFPVLLLGTVTEWNGKADASFVFRCSDLTGLEAEAVVSIF